MNVLDTLGNAVTGGVVGWLGAIGKDVAAIFVLKEKNAHELKMTEFKLKELELEMKQSAADALSREKIAMVTAESANYVSSVENDKATYGIKIVDMVRGMMRPALTSYCLLWASYLTISFYQNGAKVSPQLFDELVGTFTFLTSASFMWWFGSRRNAKK